ncbi:MAG TPA: hypothetical protein DHW37_08075, partial [Veillonella dispar]|nr:hypothetical protein [Veillonella dispar]
MCIFLNIFNISSYNCIVVINYGITIGTAFFRDLLLLLLLWHLLLPLLLLLWHLRMLTSLLLLRHLLLPLLLLLLLLLLL